MPEHSGAAGSPSPSIGDYALIGDCRSAALVSRSGSLDWLCWPRFDSPSVFAGLLDRERGGHFAVTPVGPAATTRRYVGHTNVLETTHHTDRGVVRIVDFMPVESEAEKRRTLWPDHQVLRVIDGVEGEVEIEVVCAPRPNYARRIPRLTRRGRLGVRYEHGGQVLVLHSDIPLRLTHEHAEARGRITVRAGSRHYAALVFADREPLVLPQLGEEADRKLVATLRWWERWAERCRYEGPHRDAVVRSALVLKLLSYAPSGAVIAAPTTSLPEKLGGVRNWDYRYCWLRDSSMTLQALFDLGYRDEAEAFVSWLLYATRITRPELQILYDVYGESHLPERELPHLAGFADSRPVRIGNDARSQLQLDVYGEVLDAVYEFVHRGGTLDRATARMLVAFGKAVCRRWREPDEGIWEVRGGRRHHTYSKVMCWVALDRLLRLHDERHVAAPVGRFTAERDAIREAVERDGYNAQIASYVSVFGGDAVDASLLLLARYGWAEPGSPRMRGTLSRIRQELDAGGLLYRYKAEHDGLPAGEGAFGICGFWGVVAEAAGGKMDRATDTFERLVGLGNDVGLFAEEIDPDSGAALGNFPQAFTHVGLIDAALSLAAATGGPARRSGVEHRRQTDARL